MDILPPHVPLFTLVLEITVVVICCFHRSCCFISNSYAMANEGLWNITVPIPRAKPEG